MESMNGTPTTPRSSELEPAPGGSFRAFGDVDGTADPLAFARYLERTSDHPVLRERNRRRAREVVRTGDRIVDLGCGIGSDTMMLADLAGASGEAMGVDRSARLIGVARQRASDRGYAATFRVGDACALEEADRRFDVVWIERLLVHLQDPASAVREAFRLLSPGGRLVVQEFDYAGLIIDSDDPELTDRVVARCATMGASPRTARALVRLARQTGFEETTYEATLHAMPTFALMDSMLGLGSCLRALVANREVTAARAEAWVAFLREATAAGTFVGSVPGMTLTAVKPEVG
jgi:ubiquinone/menaquinone biosynthesis C-methylase UbiE